MGTDRQTDRGQTGGSAYMKLAMLSWMLVWERNFRAIWPSTRLRCLSISTEEEGEEEVVVVVVAVVVDRATTTCVSIAAASRSSSLTVGRGGEKEVMAVIVSLVVVGGRGGHGDMSIKPWEAQKSRRGRQRIHFSNLPAARTMAALASGAETRERGETGVVAVVAVVTAITLVGSIPISIIATATSLILAPHRHARSKADWPSLFLTRILAPPRIMAKATALSSVLLQARSKAVLPSMLLLA